VVGDRLDSGAPAPPDEDAGAFCAAPPVQAGDGPSVSMVTRAKVKGPSTARPETLVPLSYDSR
jgi:hypothetical protein